MAEPFVYDKAKWHQEGDFPEDLPGEQALVHTGLYLGWIIDHDLYSDEFREASQADIAAFKERSLTGPEVYGRWDGCLLDEMLSDEGNAFSREYFDFSSGQFLRDYEELLAPELPSLYHVENTWANYERLKGVLDERYADWRRRHRTRWWQLGKR